MAVIKVSAADFEKEVLQSDKPVLVDFYADWCGPCKMLAPVLAQVAEEHPEYKICKVNVDEESALAAKFGVMSIPTLFVIKNGEITNHAMGAMPKARILDLL